MIVTHNIQSMNINRITNDNINLHGKSTKKVSSGYRINRSADDPAGLAISEVLRRQVRGLTQAVNNTKDGVAFVQTADSAMEEIHSMLQRMNELTIKALQGTYSDSDRMAINVEFDQLRTEIDRINNVTEFGTGIPVFEEHAASYYQICGNKKWDDNELHTITPMANELNIHLPDSYEPKDYTITVPPGTYTTQELVDEIDSALNKMEPPNPGFVFELTSDGYCNVNFEKTDGTPTKIDFVDGSLAYLIYDFNGGTGSNDILGTTEFKAGDKFYIVEGKNDELGFYLEGAAAPSGISIKIPAKPEGYTRDEMIDTINKLLEEAFEEKGIEDAGVAAVPSDDGCIKIIGGSNVAVTGLYGNMFKIDGAESRNPFISVFYDNIKYGTCSKWPANVTGKTNVLPIRISGTNNTLKFKLNGEKDIKITIPYDTDKGYTDYPVWELADKLRDLLKGEEVEVSTVGNSISLSTKKEGEFSSLEFDTSESLYKDTYKTLFFSTSGLPEKEQSSIASVIGIPDLRGGIELTEKDSFMLFITDSSGTGICSFNKLEGTYTLDELVTKLNGMLSPALKEIIVFERSDSGSGSYLVVRALTSDVKSISPEDTSERDPDTSKKLFSGEVSKLDGSFALHSGKKETIEGTLTVNRLEAIATSSPYNKDSGTIKIDEKSNTITFNLTCNGSRIVRTITIESGEYDLVTLARKINEQLGENSDDLYLHEMSAAMVGNRLQFSFMPVKAPTMSDGDWSLDISFDPKSDATNNSIWKEFFNNDPETGFQIQLTEPATLTTMFIPVSKDTGIVIDETNCSLRLSINGGVSYVALPSIAPGRYDNLGSLATAVQNAINSSSLAGKVSVSVVGGKLRFATPAGSFEAGALFEADGTFYEGVMCRGMYDIDDSFKKGGCSYDPALIVGRQDLTAESIEIIAGSNDIFTFDYTHNDERIPMSVKIPEGTYNGYELADMLEKLIQARFKKEGLDDFEVVVSIGPPEDEDIKVPDIEKIDESTVLVIALKQASGKEPDEGEYIIDGIRGSAANSIFYKSTTVPSMTYIVGTKDIRGGVSFEPGKNVLTLSANSVPYKYTFDKPYYTADEFLDALNSMFENGDDNGNSAPLRATIDKSGALKLSYTVAGPNTITDIGGSGRSAIFFVEEGRESRDPLLIHVGSEAHQYTEIPRISVSSAALNINSITVSKQKYAEKANVRIKEAITLLSSKRSIYGALQNRLEHTINDNNIVIDRVQESESRIRDTDLSSEMIQYSNLSILLKMGATMIAESNQRIEKLMTILQ